MFENLSERLSGVFDRLTKQGALSEEDVKTALREVRVALHSEALHVLLLDVADHSGKHPRDPGAGAGGLDELGGGAGSEVDAPGVFVQRVGSENVGRRFGFHLLRCGHGVSPEIERQSLATRIAEHRLEERLLLLGYGLVLRGAEGVGVYDL